jgi:hypothetical protein
MKSYGADKVHPKAQVAYETFGYSVAVSGDTLVVGALANQTGKGAAYVFVHGTSGWKQQTKLLPTTSANGDWFGAAVGVDGDWAAVGSHGSVCIFNRTGTSWSLHTTLSGKDHGSDRHFGLRVSLNGGRLATSGPAVADGGTRVFLFVLQNNVWSIEMTQSAAAGALCLDADRLILSTGTSNTILAKGSNGWGLDGHVASGRAVALSGTRAVSGEGLTESGRATPSDFGATGWVDAEAITGQAGFGYSVALSPKHLLVGQMDPDALAKAHLYAREGGQWTETAHIVPSAMPHDPKTSWFGFCVALSDRYAVVGAWLASDLEPVQGLVYVTDLNAPPPAPGGSKAAGLGGFLAQLAMHEHGAVLGNGASLRDSLPRGIFVVAYRDEQAKQDTVRAISGADLDLAFEVTPRVDRAARLTAKPLVVTPRDEKQAAAWLLRQSARLARARTAPLVLLVKLGSPAHRLVARSPRAPRRKR